MPDTVAETSLEVREAVLEILFDFVNAEMNFTFMTAQDVPGTAIFRIWHNGDDVQTICFDIYSDGKVDTYFMDTDIGVDLRVNLHTTVQDAINYAKKYMREAK